MRRALLGLTCVIVSISAAAQDSLDPMRTVQILQCERFTDQNFQKFNRDSFGLALQYWVPEVWQAFETRALDCWNQNRVQFGGLVRTQKEFLTRIKNIRSSTEFATTEAIRKQREINNKIVELDAYERDRPQRELRDAEERKRIEDLTRRSRERTAEMLAESERLARLNNEREQTERTERDAQQKLGVQKAEIAAAEKKQQSKLELDRELASVTSSALSCEQIPGRFALMSKYWTVNQERLAIAAAQRNKATICEIVEWSTLHGGLVREASMRCKQDNLAISVTQMLDAMNQARTEEGCR